MTVDVIFFSIYLLCGLLFMKRPKAATIVAFSVYNLILILNLIADADSLFYQPLTKLIMFIGYLYVLMQVTNPTSKEAAQNH